MSIHDHNTRSKKHLSFEDAMEKMESNILEQISSSKVDVRSMKDEFLNMKDVVIKRLQDENALLRSRCSKLEDKVVSLESLVNQVEQYGRKNNISKLININSEMKHNFSRNNKSFINENLTRANESIHCIAYCNSKIHSCFTRDGLVFIKKTEKSKAYKAHHMNVFYDVFPEFDFFDDDGCELYHDASPSVSGQSSY